MTCDITARPFAYWVRAVDHLIARATHTVLENEGLARRDWRLLTLLSDESSAPGLAERLRRRGGAKFVTLIERGWVAETDGEWTLTDEGRAAQARLAGAIDGVIAGAVSEEDLATTRASLHTIARTLGWNPDERIPHGRRGRRGFGPRHHGHGNPAFRPGFRGVDPEHGFGFGPGFRPGFRPAFGPGFRPAFGPRGSRPDAHGAEQAFERGFDAGFARGVATRDA